MPQEVALKVVDVAGIVIFEGKVCGKMEIPVDLMMGSVMIR